MHPVCHLCDRGDVLLPGRVAVAQCVVVAGEESEAIGGVAGVGGKDDGVPLPHHSAGPEVVVDELTTDEIHTIREGGGAGN